MVKDLDYSCYAYLCIDHAHNTYPIKDAEYHLGEIFSLKNGDILHIKGKGYLEVIGINVDEYDEKGEEKDILYQEIAIACVIVAY